MLFSPHVFPYWWWWWCWPNVLILPCFTLRFDNLSYFSHPAKCNNQGPHWKCNICTQSSLHCTAEMIFTLLLVLKSGSCPSVHCWPSLYIDCCCQPELCWPAVLECPPGQPGAEGQRIFCQGCEAGKMYYPSARHQSRNLSVLFSKPHHTLPLHVRVCGWSSPAVLCK